MWPIIGIIFAASVIFSLQFPGIWKKQNKKEIACFIIALLTAVTMSIWEARGMNVPNPLDYVKAFYAWIFSWFDF